MNQKILFLIGFFSIILFSHPNGTSKVFFNLYPGQGYLDLVADVNSGDILNLVAIDGNSDSIYYKPREMENKIAHYLQSFLILEVDGDQLNHVKVIKWHKNAQSPDDGLDSALLSEKTLVITMRYKIPEEAEMLEFSSQMFAQYELMAICHSRVIFQGDTIKQKTLLLEDPLDIPLKAEAIQALWESSQQKLKAKKNQKSKYDLNNPKKGSLDLTLLSSIIGGVLVVFLVSITLRLRRSKKN